METAKGFACMSVIQPCDHSLRAVLVIVIQPAVVRALLSVLVVVIKEQ